MVVISRQTASVSLHYVHLGCTEKATKAWHRQKRQQWHKPTNNTETCTPVTTPLHTLRPYDTQVCVSASCDRLWDYFAFCAGVSGWSMIWFCWGCTASCGWHMRCIVIRGDAWLVLHSPCNTQGTSTVSRKRPTRPHSSKTKTIKTK